MAQAIPLFTTKAEYANFVTEVMEACLLGCFHTFGSELERRGEPKKLELAKCIELDFMELRHGISNFVGKLHTLGLACGPDMMPGGRTDPCILNKQKNEYPEYAVFLTSLAKGVLPQYSEHTRKVLMPKILDRYLREYPL